MLLHVVDASDPGCEEKLAAVERLLVEIGLGSTPILHIFNKMDRTGDIQLANLSRRHNGVGVSGIDPGSLPPLIEEASRRLGELGDTQEETEYEQAAI
jgi:GTP-binding protein HflX